MTVAKANDVEHDAIPHGQQAPACTVVIFGAAGDLTKRLLIPALYNLARTGLLPEKFALVGVDRLEMTDAAFRQHLDAAVRAFAADKHYSQVLDELHWNELLQRISYLPGDFGDPLTYAGHLVMFPSGHGFYDLYGRNMIHTNNEIAAPLSKQHDWNSYEILAQGNRIRFVLNGKLVSDWREPEPDRIKSAPIGLQLHSNKQPQEVQWRNLKLETFPDDKLLTVK